MAKAMLLSLVFTVNWQMLKRLHHMVEHQSFERRVVIVFAKNIFPASFRRKKLDF